MASAAQPAPWRGRTGAAAGAQASCQGAGPHQRAQQVHHPLAVRPAADEHAHRPVAADRVLVGLRAARPPQRLSKALRHPRKRQESICQSAGARTQTGRPESGGQRRGRRRARAEERRSRAARRWSAGRPGARAMMYRPAACGATLPPVGPSTSGCPAMGDASVSSMLLVELPAMAALGPPSASLSKLCSTYAPGSQPLPGVRAICFI